MLKLQSIGIIAIARGDMKTQTHIKAIVTKAAARAAVLEVWNSLIYEYPADVAPATLHTKLIHTLKFLFYRTIQIQLTMLQRKNEG